MRITCLEEYGIPRSLIDAWVSGQSEDLLPLQERAVRDYDLLGDGSLIISAPTSSGKTFCGELASARALSQRHKVIFVVPLKALAEERFAEFRERYSPLGIRTVVSTRDRYEYDRAIESGEFDLGIVIYEKFNQMLLRNLDLLNSIDLLIVDELQMLADESRGAVLELLLMKTLRSSYDCRIIGLSAVLSNARQLADWLGANLLVESRRPVELRQGVLFNDKFSYRCFNSGERGSEQMASMQDASPAEVLLENVARLADKGEQILVFLKCKSSCVQLAAMLAERVSFTDCDDAVEELALDDTTVLCEPLIDVVKNGVAFHHADLSSRQRKSIEKYYIKGDIRVIFATTTLSLGLNLPAQTTFLETYRYRQGEYTGKPVVETLPWNDYENMCGRAGRLRFPTPYGRSVLVAGNELENEMLWRSYIRGKPNVLMGHMFSRALSDLVLDLIASRCVTTRADLSDALRSSFSDAPDNIDQQTEDALRSMSENDLIMEIDGELSPTAFGQKLARLGISTATGSHLRDLFDTGSDYGVLVWLYEFCLSFEASQIHVPVNVREDLEQHLFARFRSSAGKCDCVSDNLSELLNNPHRVNKNTISRIRLVLALHDWIDGRDIVEIEKEYGIYSGTIHAAGDTIGWLAEAAFRLMGVDGLPFRRRIPLKRLSFEVRFGLPASARKLHAAVTDHLSRQEILSLGENGISTPAELMASDKSFLSNLIGNSKLEVVLKKLMESPASAMVPPAERRSVGDRCSVTLNFTGATARDRYRVLLCDRPLLLTAKSFKYLFKLAAQKKLDSDGWLDKEQLEPGFNQARYLYNLKRELGGARVAGQDLIENDRRGGYRLSLASDEIAFDLKALSRLDDFEIVELSRQLSSS